MNNSPKVLLTIDLVGIIGNTQNTVEIIPFSYETDINKNAIEEVKGHSKHKNKVILPCTQKIKIGEDAYEGFISGEVPYWSKDFIWSKMNRIERIKAHCARIADGKEFHFDIL